MPDYRVEIEDANAHLFRVTLTLAAPAARQALTLPTWVPGSYMLRDMARHFCTLLAQQGGRAVPLLRDGKARWIASCEGDSALLVSASVYAFDSSVRGAYLDGARGFFNGSSLFLRAEGRDAEPHRLHIGALPRGWQIATTMPPTGRRGFVAADYAELIDHPFEMGRFWRGGFEAAGVGHEFVVSGAWPGFDGARLLADAQRLCEQQIRFWHGRGRPPFERYLFLLHLLEDGHGGLEHRSSSALVAARRDLPRPPLAEASDAYVSLLSLISHEYFHAWNIKRLKPRDLAAPDLSREAPTALLWFFEGFTAYYDELFLRRSGLIDAQRYLRLLAGTINALQATPGRRVQSVADAGADAWIKHDRSDENTANATVSYYTKGALVALLCDLRLRQRGSSLDAAMRSLWRTSGGDAFDEDNLFDALAAPGDAQREQLHGWVHSTAELPLTAELAAFGIVLNDEAPSLAAMLGLKLSEGPLSGIQVRQVLRGSAGEAAGLAAGDELLAVDGWRLRRLEDARQWLAPGGRFKLLAARDQRVLTLNVERPAVPAAASVTLRFDERAAPAALARRRAWLGG